MPILMYVFPSRFSLIRACVIVQRELKCFLIQKEKKVEVAFLNYNEGVSALSFGVLPQARSVEKMRKTSSRTSSS